ncbi:MAG: hypothetical protein NC452_08320 [Eubacterium sp.]|nr:hypothetical protein [Eubacterium sp.]
MSILAVIFIIIFLLPILPSIIQYIKDSAEHKKYLKQFEINEEKDNIETVPKTRKKGVVGGIIAVLVLALFIETLILVNDNSDISKNDSVTNKADTEKNVTDNSTVEQTTSQSLTIEDNLNSEMLSTVKNGEGYSFDTMDMWKLLDAGDEYDFDLFMNIPFIQKGVISTQIQHYYLSEMSFDDETPDFETYVNYDYEVSKILFSLSEEDITVSDSFEESRKIGNASAYKYYTEQTSDIVSLDLSKAIYGTDEYGNIIITNIDFLSTITYHDVPCRSEYYFVENGDEVIEIAITYTIENEDDCIWYIDQFLDGITLYE